MKVLYLSYDGMTDPLGQSQVIPYLCGLAQLGHQIHLVSFEKKEAYASTKAVVEKVLEHHQIIWHPLSYTKKPPVVSTLKDIFTLYHTCKELYLKEKYDLLHCRSYITPIVALALKKKYGVPFIFDMRGFWADERVEGKIWNLQNPLFKAIYNYFKKLEIKFLQQSSRIVSLTHTAKEELITWNVVPSSKIHVIPCCADLEHFTIQDPALAATTRMSLGIRDTDRVISYIGSLGTWYMIEEMLSLFLKIQRSFPQSKLLLITKHSKKEILPYLSQTQIDPKSVIIKAGSRAEMPLLISASDISMFFVRPTYSKKASSPTKMGEIMGCGIPLICNAGVGDVEKIMNETQAGICMPDFSAASQDRVVQQMSYLLHLDPLHIRQGATMHFSLQEGIRSYHTIYLSVKKCNKEK